MRLFFASLLSSVLLASTLGHAQAPPPPPSRPVSPEPPRRLGAEQRARLREAVQQKVERYLTTELSTRLGLDEARAQKLGVAVEAHLQRKKDRRQQLKAEMQKLEQLSAATGTSDAALLKQIDAVTAARADVDDLSDFWRDARGFLNAREQARLVVALPDVLRDLSRLVRDARRDRRGRNPPDPRSDDDDDE